MAKLIPFDPEKWNPLEDGPAEYVVPSIWTGPHVGHRLVEMFETLRRIPMSHGPKQFGCIWPGYRLEWEDFLAQICSSVEVVRARNAARNRVRTFPTSVAVSRMEKAISWPGKYIEHKALRMAVQRMALAISLNRDAEWVVHEWGGFIDTVNARNRMGCDLIAAGLNRDEEPVE